VVTTTQHSLRKHIHTVIMAGMNGFQRRLDLCSIMESRDLVASQIDEELQRKRGPKQKMGAWDACLARWKSLPKHKRRGGESRPICCSPTLASALHWVGKVIGYKDCDEST